MMIPLFFELGWGAFAPLLLVPAPLLLREKNQWAATAQMCALLMPLSCYGYLSAAPLLPPGAWPLLLLPGLIHLPLSAFLAWVVTRSGAGHRPFAWAAALLVLDVLPGDRVFGIFADVSTPGLALLPGMWLWGPHGPTCIALLVGVAFATWGRRAWPTVLLCGLPYLMPMPSSGDGVQFSAAQSGDTALQVVNGLPQQRIVQRRQDWLTLLDQPRGTWTVLPEVADLALQRPGQQVSYPSDVLYGGLSYDGLHVYNAVIMADRVRYRKRLTVPVTEDWLSPGDAPGLLRLGSVSAGLLICVEGMFPAYAAELARAGAHVLIVPTATRHRRAAAMQEQAIVAASVSSGLSLVLASDAGNTQLRNPSGGLLARAEWGRPQLITADLPPGRASLYARTQPYELPLLSVLLLLTCSPRRKAERHQD